MNYFYAYVEDEREEQEMRQLQKKLQDAQEAVCFLDHGGAAQWEYLQSVWKKGDTLIICDIAHLASEDVYKRQGENQ